MGKALPDDLNTLKVTELKEALKERSLTVSGNKADLVARLQEFLNKQSSNEEGEEAGDSSPKKKASSDGETQNGGTKEEEKVGKEEEGQKEKEDTEKENTKKAQKEKQQREKEAKEQERREKEQKEAELREKEQKEAELREKEEKEREQQETKDKKEEAESNKDEEKQSQEDKKRKSTDDEDTTESTPNRTLTKPTASSSTSTSTPKRPRTWANNTQPINISTDILKEMLPTSSSPPTEDADMSDAGARTSRPAQQVYTAPARKEKKEEETEGAREVPPARKPASATLFIDRFVRPFTLGQVKHLLSNTGEIEYFWMNQVKSQAYVTFKTVEQATATREAIYDLAWPPGNGSKLRAEFSSEEEAKTAAEKHDQKRAGPAPTTPTSAPFGRGSEGVAKGDTRTVVRDARDRDSRDARDSRDPRDSRGSMRDSRDNRRAPPPPKKTLEDLFNKTVALPSIYWLGLTAEQIAAKKSTSASDR